jgi:uncharacterized protein
MSPSRVRCPTCERELEWDRAPFRPFCSERCRLIDLGAWLSGERAIPAEATPVPPEDADPAEGGPRRT